MFIFSLESKERKLLKTVLNIEFKSMNHDPWHNSNWIKVPGCIPERLSSLLPRESKVIVSTCDEFVKPNLNFFENNHDVNKANRRMLYRIIHEHHIHNDVDHSHFVDFFVTFKRKKEHLGCPAEKPDEIDCVINPSRDETCYSE